MRLYHITERKNLSNINRRGLRPRLDKNIDAEGLSKGKVVNLVEREALDFVWSYFPDEGDFVILELELPDSAVQVVYGKESGAFPGFPWYVSRDPIPSTAIMRVWTPEELLDI